MPSVGAVLDADVLIPAALRDTLLRAAEEDLYRPFWSALILEEVRSNLVEHGLTNELRASRLISAMRRAFPVAEIELLAPLVATMTNHPKDRHVVAAAVTARADIIVTHNTRHFPASALAPWNVVAESPDRFLTRLFEDEPVTMMQILTDQAESLIAPSRTVEELLSTLILHAPTFVERVRTARRHST